MFSSGKRKKTAKGGKEESVLSRALNLIVSSSTV